MPIYEYSCEGCKTRVETIKSREDASPEICIVCKKPMEKLISLGSFHLKGAGWARDGYARPSISFTSKRGKTQSTPYNPNKVPKS